MMNTPGMPPKVTCSCGESVQLALCGGVRCTCGKWFQDNHGMFDFTLHGDDTVFPATLTLTLPWPPKPVFDFSGASDKPVGNWPNKGVSIGLHHGNEVVYINAYGGGLSEDDIEHGKRYRVVIYELTEGNG